MVHHCHHRCPALHQAGDKRGAAAAALDLASAQLLQQQPDEAMASAEEARALCPSATSRGAGGWVVRSFGG